MISQCDSGRNFNQSACQLTNQPFNPTFEQTVKSSWLIVYIKIVCFLVKGHPSLRWTVCHFMIWWLFTVLLLEDGDICFPLWIKSVCLSMELETKQWIMNIIIESIVCHHSFGYVLLIGKSAVNWGRKEKKIQISDWKELW